MSFLPAPLLALSFSRVRDQLSDARLSEDSVFRRLNVLIITLGLTLYVIHLQCVLPAVCTRRRRRHQKKRRRDLWATNDGKSEQAVTRTTEPSNNRFSSRRHFPCVARSHTHTHTCVSRESVKSADAAVRPVCCSDVTRPAVPRGRRARPVNGLAATHHGALPTASAHFSPHRPR